MRPTIVQMAYINSLYNQQAASTLDELKDMVYDCPECGTPLVNGRCPAPAKHGGGNE